MGMAHERAILDIAAFYDSMDWVKLGRAALRLGFPPTMLALAPAVLRPAGVDLRRSSIAGVPACQVHRARVAQGRGLRAA
eukprot:7012185-Pyramimonas_sp.AAC.1